MGMVDVWSLVVGAIGAVGLLACLRAAWRRCRHRRLRGVALDDAEDDGPAMDAALVP